jgi:hypothetical protein
MNLAERINRIAPQYHPGIEDLHWFESELERFQDRALPKLIRKRFVDSLRATSKSSTCTHSASASPTAPAKGVVPAASTSR